MAINKVEYNGEVLMDLTEDTVTEETLASGVTAHNAAGESITGRMAGGVQSDWAQTDETQLDYIKNKPGDSVATENTIELLNVNNLQLEINDDYNFYGTMLENIETRPNVGDSVEISLTLPNSENAIVFNDIISEEDENCPLVVKFNTSTRASDAMSKDDNDGIIKINPEYPAIIIVYSPEEYKIIQIISSDDCSGASIVISKTETINDYIKLPNEALTFDSEPTENSENLITSGGVYNALQNSGEPYIAGNLIKIENGVISSTLGDGHAGVQETQVFETNYLANGDNTTMPPFYVWQYLDNPTPFVVGDNVYLYCTDSSGVEKLVGEGVMEQNDSIDAIFGSGDQIGCKFNISSSWSDLFGLSTGVPIINPVDSSITINGNVAQFIFLQNLNVPNVVIFGAAQDYPNIKFRVSKDMLATVYVKLPNEALTFDDMPIGGSENLITSGGVYEAIENGKEIIYIPTELGFNENGIPTTATLIGVTHADILEHIEQGKEPKLKVFSEAIGLQSGIFPLVFHTLDDSLIFQLTMPTEPYWIINIIVTQDNTTLQTVQNLNSDSVVDASVEDITGGWDEYVPTVGAAKNLISAMTSKNLKPFEIKATINEDGTLSNVSANGLSSEEADIYTLISNAYNNDDYIYIELIKSNEEKVFLQLTNLDVSKAVFTMVVKHEEMLLFAGITVVIYPGNIFSYTTGAIVDDTQIQIELKKLEEIANGKCKTYVKTFRSQSDPNYILGTGDNEVLDIWLTQVDTSQFKVGDVFLIKDVGVPDYWWNGSGISELETTKVPLENYYTKTEVDQNLTNLTTQFDTKLTKKQDIRNIQLKTNANTEVRYYKLGLMAIDDSSNYGNYTFTGRLGGWTNVSTAIYSIMLMNRANYTGNIITSTVSVSGAYDEAIKLTDIVVAKNDDLSHTVYLKVTGYFCYNFDWTAYQHSIIYDGTYVITEPSNIVWRLSEAPKTILKSDGSFEASGGINATTIGGKQIVTSNSAPASGTSENIITFVY